MLPHISRERTWTWCIIITDSSHRCCLNMRYICNQKGGVWIQNRGPEQEIPAVTRVRLIAQKYQYWHLFHESYWKFHKSYWKLNWNWCFHSSAAGRIPSEEGNLDLLTTKLCLNYWTQPVHKKTTRKLRKSQEFLATISSLPVLLACTHVDSKLIWRERALF